MELKVGFLLKKLIAFLLYPLSIGMLFGFIGLWFFIVRRTKLSIFFFFLTSAWIFVVSSSFFANPLLESLESRYKKVEVVPKNIEYILILGGERQKRAWEALRLYRILPHAKIITSGYALRGNLSGAQKTKKLLIEAGVKSKDILMQNHAKDTIEEAQEIKRRLGKQPFFLVTSAYHMQRAIKIFRSLRLNAIAVPTDFNDATEGEVIRIFSAKELLKTEKAFHEYLGLLWLKIKNI